MERRWKLLQIAIGAAAGLLARRLAERAWAVMTGEVPPILGHAGEPARDLPGDDTDATHEAAEAQAPREREGSSVQPSSA